MTHLPTDVAALVAEAEALLRRGAHRQAHERCVEALQRDPRNADALFLLGALAAEHRNFKRAAELFEQAIGRDARQARFQAHLGKAYLALQRRPDAWAAAEQAVALGPADALTWDTIGVVYSHSGRHAEAVDFFRHAADADPRNANYHYNLGVSLQFSGAFEEAGRSFRRAIAIDPSRRKALSALVQLSKQTAENNFLPELEAQFEEEAEDINARLNLGHAIAKSYEDMGEPVRSLEWLIKGKAKKKVAAAFSVAEERALFDAAAEAAAAVKGCAGDPSSEPIFVIGMPRTGTTLVDRILSSHPDVMSAGELDNFAAQLKHAAGARAEAAIDSGVLNAARGFDMAAIGRGYVESTRLRTGKTAHFIDKMPRNFLLVGLIHAALPNARIVCLRRHPMDACLSNYRQAFNADSVYYRYTYDLEDTARYYVLFDRLMTRWREMLPADRFTEVRYEGLVANLESEARRLVAFCGLGWDPRCLDFHENEAPVATASSVQVRSPIYASSVGRWRRYGAALDSMRAVLEEAGLKLD